MISPEFKQVGGRYICPECGIHYSWRWIRRHLIEKHDYAYWDNSIIYNPKDPRNISGGA